MDLVLRPHKYAAAYLDDVIIHSDTRPQHLRWVAAVLDSLRQARRYGMVSGVPLGGWMGVSAAE